MLTFIIGVAIGYWFADKIDIPVQKIKDFIKNL